MKEQNYNTLKEALRQLPQHQPPKAVWEGIANEMLSYEKEAPLREAIGQLPSYEAPNDIWATIEKELKTPVRSPLKIRRYRYAAAAAVIGLLFSVWFLMPPGDPAASVSISYSSEESNPALFVSDWEEDQQDIHWIAEQFESSRAAKAHKQYENLLIEFTELNDAKAEIENIMKNYGKAPDLIHKMGKIELERTRVVKQMAALI